MIETYRLHQAAFLMVDREPPPDEMPKDAGTRTVGKVTLITPKHFDLEPKACPWDVEKFLKSFLQLVMSGIVSDLGDKLHRQEISFKIKVPDQGYIQIKTARQLVHWLHHKAENFPLEPTNINDFFPIILDRSDLISIAKILDLNPTFLQDKTTPPTEINSTPPEPLSIKPGKDKQPSIPTDPGAVAYHNFTQCGLDWIPTGEKACPEKYAQYMAGNIRKETFRSQVRRLAERYAKKNNLPLKKGPAPTS